MLDNGRTISEALMHNLARAMFIFHPALAAVMKLTVTGGHAATARHSHLL